MNLLSGRKHILVGLSGGADSCALLRSLLLLKDDYGYELSAVHVNHQIRGKEAERDAAFAENLCKKLGVEFFLQTVNVPEIAKKTGESLETAARKARYNVFENVCCEHNIDCVATAHNANDNAETVIFNLTRGSSLSGICGIPPKRALSDSNIKVIRPLIYITRDEIENYLKAVGQDFVTDSTNLQTDCSRNYIRHEIIPRLKTVNPSIEDAVCSLVKNLAYDKEYIDSAASGCVSNDIYNLSSLHMSLRTRAVRQLYEKTTGLSLLENIHVEKIICEIDECAAGEKEKSCISLPGKVKAVISNGILSFENDTREKSRNCVEYGFQLKYGVNPVPDTDFVLFVTDNKNVLPDVINYTENIYKKYNTAIMYSDKILSNLCIRNRRTADEFFFKGMYRKVKKLFSDAGITADERNLIPFITDGHEILYIPCVGVTDAYAFPGTYKTKILQIAVYTITK